MSRLIGRRGSGGSGWTWVLTGPRPRRPPRRLRPWPFALLLAAASLLLGLSFLIIWATSPRQGDQAVAQPDREAPTAETPLPSPVPSPGPRPTRFRLAQWSDLDEVWVYGDLDPTNSAYQEGETVPFLLRIDDARPGTTYTVSLRYSCALHGINAYDYLTNYERDGGAVPALSPGGPGRENPDHAIPVPDDPSMLFDDAAGPRRFQAWGATFPAAPSRPAPPTLCRSQPDQRAEKEIVVQLQAQDSTVWLLWGGHLASRLDWDAGNGAASISGEPLHMKVSVPEHGLAGQERGIRQVLPPAAP